jgi:hypothetical protein
VISALFAFRGWFTRNYSTAEFDIRASTRIKQDTKHHAGTLHHLVRRETLVPDTTTRGQVYGVLEHDTRPSLGKLRVNPPSWHTGHDVPLFQIGNKFGQFLYAIGPDICAEVCPVASAYHGNHWSESKQLNPTTHSKSTTGQVPSVVVPRFPLPHVAIPCSDATYSMRPRRDAMTSASGSPETRPCPKNVRFDSPPPVLPNRGATSTLWCVAVLPQAMFFSLMESYYQLKIKPPLRTTSRKHLFPWSRHAF